MSQSEEPLLFPKCVRPLWSERAGLACPADVGSAVCGPLICCVKRFCLHRLQARLGGRLGSSLSFSLCPLSASLWRRGPGEDVDLCSPKLSLSGRSGWPVGPPGARAPLQGDVGPLATLFAVCFHNLLSCLCAWLGRLALERGFGERARSPTLAPAPTPQVLGSEKGVQYEALLCTAGPGSGPRRREHPEVQTPEKAASGQLRATEGCRVTAPGPDVAKRSHLDPTAERFGGRPRGA